MSFEAQETSVEGGAPVELYTFIVYGVPVRYTTAATDQVVFGNTYLSVAPLKRGPFEEADEIARNDLNIDCSDTFPICEYFEGPPPDDIITLEVRRLHRTDLTTETKLVWAGRVLNCSFGDGGTAQLRCENIFTRQKTSGLTRLYGAGCPHDLYGLKGCKAPLAEHQFAGLVALISGTTLQIDGLADFPDQRFAGGFITWEPVVGQKHYRGIKSHTGNTAILTHPLPGLETGMPVLYAKGCRHDPEDCDTEFDNIVNYGGFPYIRKQNPFGGNSPY